MGEKMSVAKWGLVMVLVSNLPTIYKHLCWVNCLLICLSIHPFPAKYNSVKIKCE